MDGWIYYVTSKKRTIRFHHAQLTSVTSESASKKSKLGCFLTSSVGKMIVNILQSSKYFGTKDRVRDCASESIQSRFSGGVPLVLDRAASTFNLCYNSIKSLLWGIFLEYDDPVA